MSEQEQINLVKQSIEAFNRGDLIKAVEPFDEKATFLDIAAPQPHQGREAIRKAFESGRRACPDLKLSPTNWVVGENQVVMEYTLSGTHKGAWELPTGAVIPPTNKRFQAKGVAVATISSGRIVGLTDYSSPTVLSQLGVTPSLVEQH